METNQTSGGPQDQNQADSDVKSILSEKSLEQSSLVKHVTKIISDGVSQGASDILIEPTDTELQVRFRIDGILQKALVLPKQVQDAVISRVKVMSELDISEHRLPQDGRFKMKIKDADVDFRVSVIPTSQGEKIALRVLDKSAFTLNIDNLGFDTWTVEVIKRNLVKPFGMILSCGPTGSGKTTTLYSALKYIDSIEKNIITVEDPVEYQLFGINQVAVSEDIGMTFAGALRSILRQDPDIILVGEIRDFETVDIAVKAALTGHLLLSTLHTTSAVATIIRLVNMGIEPFLIASSLVLVVSQVLARKLCAHCREKYEPDTLVLDELRALGQFVDDKAAYYRPKGCHFCNSSGYKGRTALTECLEITPEIKDLIVNKAPESQISEAAVKNGMITLRQRGINLVKEGIISVDELLRVTAL